MRKAIYNYLGTKNGGMEINHVINELQLLEVPDAGNDPGMAEAPTSMKTNQKKRKQVREIFRKYDADGSFSIDR